MSETPESPRRRLIDVLRERTVTSDLTPPVPRGLRIAAAYAWRVIVIAAAAAIVIWLVIQLKLIVIPLLVGILVTALLWPAFAWLLRHRLPRWIAIIVAVLGTLAAVSGLIWLVVWQVSLQWQSVRDRTIEALGEFRQYLIDGPLHLTSAQIDQALVQAWVVIQEQAQLLLSGALAVGSTVGQVAVGALLTLFILLCTLADGGGIWKWTLRLFPRAARRPVDAAARAGWITVVNFARTQLLVASIDAVGIGLGAALLGVPLAIPVAVLVFLGAFIPIVGAVVTGAVAVFLALVYNGPLIAVLMLAVVLGVQQIEGHILQPLLMGAAVKVHPLGVVLVVAGGALVGGIPGALFAVPLAAFVNVFVVYIGSRAWERPHSAMPGEFIWSTVPRTRRTRSMGTKG
ncbi:MAG TPA: AI-2E family transporter [Microbacterium sp.]|nr:AI-2E family transporter [Microbacterium sp.]